MLIASIEPTLNADPWRYQQHLEIWVLIIGLIVAFVYAIRVLGPKVVPNGEVISRKQIRIFSLMIFLMWIASDWPLHDIAEEYLYSMHMLQHTILTYIVPPLALLATPEWLFRLLVGQGRTYRVIRFLTRPVIVTLPPRMSLMLRGLSGVAPAGNELAGNAFNSPSSETMRVAAAYASCIALEVAT